MSEIAPIMRLVCAGCNKNYDSANDLAPARVGTQSVLLCESCYVTALGEPKIDFARAKQLAGQPVIAAPGPVATRTTR